MAHCAKHSEFFLKNGNLKREKGMQKKINRVRRMQIKPTFNAEITLNITTNVSKSRKNGLTLPLF